jgi:hypothetical protein
MPEFPKVPKVGRLTKKGKSSQPAQQQPAPPSSPPASDQSPPPPPQETASDRDTPGQVEKTFTKEAELNPLADIQVVLESGTTAAQANLLLELTEHLAEGKVVAPIVSHVCRVSTSLFLWQVNAHCFCSAAHNFLVAGHHGSLKLSASFCVD